MPAKGCTKADKLKRPIKPGFTELELRAIAAEAKACGMTKAKYVRQLVLSARGAGEKPRRKRNRDEGRLADEVHQLGLQARKIGTNVNQLAHKANQGVVPISRGEVQYMLNQLQLMTSAAIAHLEKARA
jgi:hypothetical protein